MISNRDTIAALATPLGTSAFAIVRASGLACAMRAHGETPATEKVEISYIGG